MHPVQLLLWRARSGARLKAVQRRPLLEFLESDKTTVVLQEPL